MIASSNMFLHTPSISMIVVSATPTAFEQPLFASMTSFCLRPSSTSGPPPVNSSYPAAWIWMSFRSGS